MGLDERDSDDSLRLKSPVPAAPEEAVNAPAGEDSGAAAVEVAGSNEELGRLLEQFRPYLLAIANAQVRPEMARKVAPSDLVQESLAKGCTHYGEFRGKTDEELARWLRQILLHGVANAAAAFETEKRDVAREEPADSRLAHPRQLSPSGEALSREERLRLDAALARLPAVYAQVIRQRHEEDFSFAEIGARLGRSPDAARKLWARALRRLQKELGTDGSGFLVR